MSINILSRILPMSTIRRLPPFGNKIIIYAKQLLEQVLPQLREQSVSVHLDDALFLLSRVDARLGEFHASLDYAQEAGAIARKEGNTDEEMQLQLVRSRSVQVAS